jgi:uncharacterized membrane protein
MNNIKPTIKNEINEVVDKKSFSFQQQDIDKNRGVAALSYFFILLLIPFFIRRDSEFVKAHLRQGIVLCISQALVMFLVWIPFFGKLLALLIFIGTIYGIVQAVSGKYKALPVFGKLAEKIKL